MRPNPATYDLRVSQWISLGEHGVSSMTIAHVLAPHPVPFQWGPGVPHDPADFRRCRELLEQVPEWRDRLQEVADRFPMWIPFVREWDVIERLYRVETAQGDRAPECYEYIQRLEEESRLWQGGIPTSVSSRAVSAWTFYQGRTVEQQEVDHWMRWIEDTICERREAR